VQVIVNTLKKLKSAAVALYLAYQHPQTPWIARTGALLAIAYIASPIDLIPDFIPVLGYVDDLIFVPLLIWIAIKFIPKPIWNECQAQAAQTSISLPQFRLVSVLIVLIWLFGFVACFVYGYRLFSS